MNDELLQLIDPDKVISCKHCGSKEYNLSRKGPHIRSDCAKCGRYIQFVPQAIDWENIDWSKQIIPLPAHKGKSYAEVANTHPDYIRWMAENCDGKLRRLADAAI